MASPHQVEEQFTECYCITNLGNQASLDIVMGELHSLVESTDFKKMPSPNIQSTRTLNITYRYHGGTAIHWAGNAFQASSSESAELTPWFSWSNLSGGCSNDYASPMRPPTFMMKGMLHCNPHSCRSSFDNRSIEMVHRDVSAIAKSLQNIEVAHENWRTSTSSASVPHPGFNHLLG